MYERCFAGKYAAARCSAWGSVAGSVVILRRALSGANAVAAAVRTAVLVRRARRAGVRADARSAEHPVQGLGRGLVRPRRQRAGERNTQHATFSRWSVSGDLPVTPDEAMTVARRRQISMMLTR